MRHHRPAVGLLYNPAAPELIARAGELVEYFAVMPNRLLVDAGARAAGGRRFQRAFGAIDEVKRLAAGRLVAAHGQGLSLPSAMPLDDASVAAIAELSQELGGFVWFSEHLSVFLSPRASAPAAPAGLGLPVVYDDEAFDTISAKLNTLRGALGCRIMMENGAFALAQPDRAMSEPAFFNRLYASGRCGALLDLHNLYVGELNGGLPMQDYLAQLDPNAVEEIHLAGGDEIPGFSMDRHSGLTPPAVWRIAYEHVPRFRRLRAITFEFQDAFPEHLGTDALMNELARMHELAARCVTQLDDGEAG